MRPILPKSGKKMAPAAQATAFVHVNHLHFLTTTHQGMKKMKKLLTAAALAAFALTPIVSQATVVVEQADAISWHETFKDPLTGLIWTNANVLNESVPNFSSRNYVSYQDAITFVEGLSIGGITNWALPTKAQFVSLYISQGSTLNGLAMNFSPFSALGNTGTYAKHLNEYWTSDSPRTNYQLTFSPNSCFNCATHMFAERNSSLSGSKFDVWAVAVVPEPETYAMLLAGLGLIGAVARRRKAK